LFQSLQMVNKLTDMATLQNVVKSAVVSFFSKTSNNRAFS
ncbi:hypothetical protein DOY81_002857, partial [Sarcophaga bullata]